jgi:hypothetical protein
MKILNFILLAHYKMSTADTVMLGLLVLVACVFIAGMSVIYMAANASSMPGYKHYLETGEAHPKFQWAVWSPIHSRIMSLHRYKWCARLSPEIKTVMRASDAVTRWRIHRS